MKESSNPKHQEAVARFEAKANQAIDKMIEKDEVAKAEQSIEMPQMHGKRWRIRYECLE